MSNSVTIFPTMVRGFIFGNATLRISSPFGVKRSANHWHRGVDIAVMSGSILCSAYDGIVVTKKVQQQSTPTSPSYGLYLSIESVAPDGTKFYTIYAHLHSVNNGIEVGSVVKASQPIGTTGGLPSDKPNCGSSTGAHLHLEIRLKRNAPDAAVDPMSNFLAKHELVNKSGVRIQAMGVDEYFPATQIRTLAMAKNGSGGNSISTDENATEPITKPKYKTTAADRLAPGIWQITKLLADSSVEDKQVVDCSISVQTGSLLNFFHKVCQQPLVEFMGDTFGNQYYFITRRPPTDKTGLKRLIENTLTDISEEEVMSTNLDWNREGIYSWYQYLPQGDVIGQEELQYMIPAVLFPEYAQLWGSKPLVIRSNYFNLEQAGFFNAKDSKELKENCNRVMRVMMEDFRYLVESNAYNPFVRRGSITIRGNRKIKRGTAIRLVSTNEIYHVDSVSHSFNINGNSVSRATTLNVSRGMFLPYINGVVEGGTRYSYFDIIDFGYNDNPDSITQDNFKEILSKWHVNWKVFGFFLQKQAAVEHGMDYGAQWLNKGQEE